MRNDAFPFNTFSIGNQDFCERRKEKGKASGTNASST